MRLAGRFNPATITIAVALFVVAIPFVASRFITPGSLNPRVHFVPDEPTDPLSQATGVTPVVAPVEGEVIRTAARLREVTALCFAAILYAAQQEMREQRSPRSIDDLTAGMERSGLIPPGLSRGSVPSSFSSLRPGTGKDGSTSTVHLRYRLDPVGVEVVSLGLERLDGPALIMRWPEEPQVTYTSKGTVKKPAAGFTYYAANTLNSVRIPPPFTPPAGIISLGWSRQLLRPAEVHPDARRLVMEGPAKPNP